MQEKIAYMASMVFIDVSTRWERPESSSSSSIFEKVATQQWDWCKDAAHLQIEKRVPRFWLMALNNNVVTSEEVIYMQFWLPNNLDGAGLKSLKDSNLSFCLTRILILKSSNVDHDLGRCSLSLLIREMSNISETTMAGALATTEGTKSLNSRVSSK
ncbi:hypothetical protein Bca4012_038616 [Brassica carinata]